jgi:LAGLIDADG DNA endonuclease family protein
MRSAGSDNPDSAGNQQERLSTPEQRFWFLAGLVEGEGSVHLALKAHPTTKLGVYVQPEFFIYQHRARAQLLEMAQEYFGTGRIKPKVGNPDVLVFSIISRRPLSSTVAPFLERCMRFSARSEDYATFIAALRLLEAGFQRTPEGLTHLVELAYSMNMGGKQRRVDKQVLLDRILRGHMSNAPNVERRDGPTSTAT